MKELFGQPYSESDPYWVVKGYFDRMYDDGYFIEAVGYIVKRWGSVRMGRTVTSLMKIVRLMRSTSRGLSFLMAIP